MTRALAVINACVMVAACTGGAGGAIPPNNSAHPTPTPTAVTHFSTLPPGSVLPAGSTCAAEVKARPENKGVNVAYNATTGGQSLPGSFFGSADDPRAGSQIAPRVDGNYTGTTDQILQ